MLEHQITKGSELHRSVTVTWMQHTMSVRGLRGLAQHQKVLKNTRLTSAVTAEENSDWRETDFPCVPPRLEILNRQLRQHPSVPSSQTCAVEFIRHLCGRLLVKADGRS